MFVFCFGSIKISFSESLKHFTGVKHTPIMVDFIGEFMINGEPGKVGDEIGVFTENDLPCGACVVTKPGQYGILHVYGDDPTTEETEGALPGGSLIFKVWDKELEVEFTISPEEIRPYLNHTCPST